MELENRIFTSTNISKLHHMLESTQVLRAKFFSVVSIQIFSIKNVNPSFYVKYVENGYFPLLSKFEMFEMDRAVPTRSPKKQRKTTNTGMEEEAVDE
jgi:hypothetical protein